MGIGNNATEVGGGIVVDSCSEDDGLRILLLEQLEHLAKGEGAADVSVEDEDALGLALQDGIAEMVETASGAQSRIFTQVLHLELRELLGGVLNEVAEDSFIVVADEDDLTNIGDLGESFQAMVDYRMTGDFKEGLTRNPNVSSGDKACG